jgi:N-acetylneuraminic acid mutarotase
MLHLLFNLLQKKKMVSLQNFQWNKLDISGNIPKKGSGQEVVLCNNKLYLFGGCINYKRTCFREGLYEYDLDTQKWSKTISKNKEPFKRTCFCMCKGYYDNTLIISGGAIQIHEDKTELTTDLYEFNIKTKLWTKIFDNMPTGYGQSINLYGSYLLIFGGTKGTIYTNELHLYNFITNTIIKLNTTGDIPKPVYKHQAIIVETLNNSNTPEAGVASASRAGLRNSNTLKSKISEPSVQQGTDFLYIIGGGSYLPVKSYINIYALNLNTLIWKKINLNGNIPYNRIAHTCSYNPDTKEIYLFGGLNYKLDRLNDLYIYNTITNVSTLIITDNIPDIRAFSSSIFYNGGFYISFGAGIQTIYNDIWKFQITNSVPKLSILCSNIIKQNKNTYKIPLYLKEIIYT